jgi:DNA-binding response OmpR family regulator
MTLVLVIDPDPQLRLAARRVLERAGFTVATAASDSDATIALGAAVPDLVIADLAVASLASVRRRHPNARVLALTSDGDHEDEVPNLTKPFTPSQLLAAARRCLTR